MHLSQEKANSSDDRVAFVPPNSAFLEAIEPIINILNKLRINFDIIIPNGKLVAPDGSYKIIYDEAFKYAKLRGYNVIREPRVNFIYKILFTAYPVKGLINIPCKYNVRFLYGFVTKPKTAFSYEANYIYDAILCFNDYDSEFLSAYSNTLTIGSLRDQTKIIKTSLLKFFRPQKQILYLPTHGDLSSILTHSMKLSLLSKGRYDIYVKPHFLTYYLKSEQEKLKLLKQLFINLINPFESTSKYIKTSNLVISDNSGAIWDSLNLGVPVLLFANGNEQKNYCGIKIPHIEMVEKGLILSVNESDNLESKLANALGIKYYFLQQQCIRKLFPINKEVGEKRLKKLILSMMDGSYYMKYKISHDKIVHFYESKVGII